VEVFLVSNTGIKNTRVASTVTAADRTFSFTASQSGANDSLLVKVNTGFTQNYSAVVPAGAGPFTLSDLTAQPGYPSYTLPDVAGVSNVEVDLSALTDTAALNAAILAAAGKTILLGNHTLTATIDVPSGTTIRAKNGLNGTLKVANGATFPIFTVSGKTNVRIQNFKFSTVSGTGGAGSGGVFISGDSRDVTLTNLTSDKVYTPFYVFGGTGVTCKRITLTNCVAVSTGASSFGIEIDECDGVTLIDCKTLSSGLDGVKLRKRTNNILILGGYFTGATGGDGLDAFAGGNNFTVIGTTFSGNSINGMTIKDDALNKTDPTAYGLVGNVTISGVRCHNNTGNGLTFHRGDAAPGDPTIPLPVRCTVLGGSFIANGAAGILIGGRQVSLHGVQCARNQQQGIRIIDKAIDIVLVGAMVSGNGVQTVNTYDGIYVGGDRVQIIGGFSIGADDEAARDEADLAALTKQQRYGLNIASTATNVDVNSSFRARYNATANILDAGIGTLRFMPGVAQMPSAGRYMVQTGGVRTTITVIQSTEYATPIIIGEAGTILRIGTEVLTIGALGSVLRLALRRNLNNFPGPVIGQTTIAGDGLGSIEATVSWDIPTPGVYWLSTTGQHATPASLMPNIRATAGTFAPVTWSTLSSAMSATPLAGYITSATITGALTDTFTIANRTGAPPLLALRF
jgi:hypothetical protein